MYLHPVAYKSHKVHEVKAELIKYPALQVTTAEAFFIINHLLK